MLLVINVHMDLPRDHLNTLRVLKGMTKPQSKSVAARDTMIRLNL